VTKQQIFPGMFAQSQTTCNECGGRGKVIAKKCHHCQGNKVVDHTAAFTLEVTPGMPEGYEVVFEGEADESPDWEPGDVVIRVRSRKDKGGWRRKESSLYWKENIGIDDVRLLSRSTLTASADVVSCLQALLGFDHNLTHLDGHVVRLARHGVTQPGRAWRCYSSSRSLSVIPLGFVQTIKGEGMPIFEKDSHGDLFIEYNVVLPTELTTKTRRSELSDSRLSLSADSLQN
jgi:DnaJ-related protein SCJ1